MSLPHISLPAFGPIEPARVLAIYDLFAVVQDKFPVSLGHTLIIARRAATRYHDLTTPEKARLLIWVDWTQEKLINTLATQPGAFNLGINDGPAAGQTIPQFHFHIIPRPKKELNKRLSQRMAEAKRFNKTPSKEIKEIGDKLEGLNLKKRP